MVKLTFSRLPSVASGTFAVGGEEIRRKEQNEESSGKLRKVSKGDIVKSENMVDGSIGQFGAT